MSNKPVTALHVDGFPKHHRFLCSGTKKRIILFHSSILFSYVQKKKKKKPKNQKKISEQKKQKLILFGVNWYHPNPTYQTKRCPPSSVPIRASESSSTGARAPTQTPGDARGWQLKELKETRHWNVSVGTVTGTWRRYPQPHLLPSDSVNTCRVEPVAEWDEVTTRDLYKPTTTCMIPSHMSVSVRLQHDSNLSTHTQTMINSLNVFMWSSYGWN